jgi:hypothetical protein
MIRYTSDLPLHPLSDSSLPCRCQISTLLMTVTRKLRAGFRSIVDLY